MGLSGSVNLFSDGSDLLWQDPDSGVATPVVTRQNHGSELALLGANYVNLRSGVAASAFNTLAVQVALALKGIVCLSQPGQFYLNDTLVMYDDTRLVLGPKTELVQAAGTNKAMLVGSQCFASGTAVTLSWSAGLDVTVTHTAHGKSVGDYVWLYGGAPSMYVGVFRISSITDANTYVVLLRRVPSGAATGSWSVKTPNQNTSTEGGIWNYNYTENPSGAGTNRHAIILSGVRCSVERARFKDVYKYCVNFGASVHARSRDVFAETNSDIIKVYGPAFDTDVDGIQGRCGDDAVSLQTKEPPAYAHYDWTSGDIITAKISNVHIQQTSTSIIVLYGTSTEFMTDVEIDSYSVAKPTVMPLRIDNGFGLTGVRFGKIVISGAKRLDTTSAQPLCKVTANGTIYHLVVEGFDFSGNTADTAQFETGSSCEIDLLTIRGFSGTISNNNYVCILSGTLRKVVIEDNILAATTFNTGRFVSIAAPTCRHVVMARNRFYQLDKAIDIGSGAQSGLALDVRDNDFDACYVGVAVNQTCSVAISGNRGTFNTNGFLRTNGAAIVVDIHSDGTNRVDGGPWISKAVGTETIKVRGLDFRADVTTVARVDGGVMYNTNAAAGTLGAAGLVMCQGTAANSWKLMANPAGASY